MHVPNPFGKVPLVLRDVNNTTNVHKGELLMDYTNMSLYHVNPETGETVRLADTLYKQMISARLENTKIKVTHTDDNEDAEEPELPAIEDRSYNTFYLNIFSRKDSDETSSGV